MTATPVVQNGFDAIGKTNLTLNRIDAFFVVQKAF